MAIISFNRILFALAAMVPTTAVPVVAQPASRTSAPPWLISNGETDSEIYVPRDIERLYQSGTRSRDGKPGPIYWQNHATHKIKVTLAPPNKRVQGEQEIIYTNNSPDPMPLLIFRLYLK